MRGNVDRGDVYERYRYIYKGDEYGNNVHRREICVDDSSGSENVGERMVE